MRVEFAVTLHHSDQEVAARSKDLSETGIAIFAPTKLAMRSKVGLELAIPGSAAVVRANGHVVRCTQTTATGREHELAIAFTDMAPLDRAALVGFVTKGKRARP